MVLVRLKKAKEVGIKPILGCEIYVAPGSRFDREQGRGEDRYYHLVLLAENNQGYKNLMKIVTRGFTEGYYYKPRVDYEVLEKYHEGIIALSACLAGEIPNKILKEDFDGARAAANKMRDIFGENNFFLELQDHGIRQQTQVNTSLIRLSRELGIPMVVTNDVHYIREEDAVPHDLLLCIQTGKKVSDQDRMRYEGGQYYLKSEEEMQKVFPYAREAMDNTHKIAERCNVEIVFGEQKVPKFDVPEGYDAFSYLKELCETGLVKRYGDSPPQELQERLSYELSTIKNMGYVDYFLIVWDFIRFAKSQGIAVGPGRGSAAGSIVSYCLEITNIDPIRYQLIFERFLNPERVSMPDIDIDFCYERRQEVIDYACQFIGNPYVWGGTSLTDGADCSGFVQSVYAHFGISLPRTSYEQRSAGYEVSYEDAQPGDLILYEGHVGLYIGNDQIVNAMNEAQGIGISSATYTNIVAVRRIY